MSFTLRRLGKSVFLCAGWAALLALPSRLSGGRPPSDISDGKENWQGDSGDILEATIREGVPFAVLNPLGYFLLLRAPRR